MHNRLKVVLKRGSILLGSLSVFVLLLMYFLPILYIDTINSKVKELMAESIEGEVHFEHLDLSFFEKFPLLTATVYKPVIQGVELDSISTGNLFEAKSFSLGIEMLSLIQGKIAFNRVYIDNPYVNISINELGTANYDIFKVDNSPTDETESDLELKIDHLYIDNAEVVYNDLFSKLSFVASEFNYFGSGNMSDAIFLLKSKASIASFDFNFDGIHYVKQKPILADLETQVDTKSLFFTFKKNDIRIKGLPVDFKGHFGFIENGYDMLFDIRTENAGLDQLLTVIPPEYDSWLENLIVKGDVSGNLLMDGKYVIVDSLAPDIDFKLKLKDGYLLNRDVSIPLESVNLDLSYHLPGMNPDKGLVKIDTLNFLLDEKISGLKLELKGISEIVGSGFINSNMDLEVLHKALRLEGFTMKGDFSLEGEFEGLYSKGVVSRKTLRRSVVDTVVDTVVTSIPLFSLNGSIKNGYFKLDDFSKALEEINIDMNVTAKDSIYKNIAINLPVISMVSGNNYLKGNIYLKNLYNYDMESSLSASIDLDEVKDIVPLKDLVAHGELSVEANIDGTFEPKRKLFPVIDSEFKLENGYLKFKKMEELPIEDIHIHTQIKSSRGSLNDLLIKVLPIDFKIAGEPFQIAASLYNLNNLDYNVKSKGTLDLGNLYKLFRIDGVDIKGRVLTSIFLSGLQSDALNGDFDKLKNGGRFEVDNITISSEMFPKPLHIHKGVFKMFKEKMKFERFEATYGSSNFKMNGYLTNVIDYLLKGDTLSGRFDLQSSYFNVDELMVFSESGSSQTSSSGVIQVPSNLNMTFNASVDNIKYTNYRLDQFNGNVSVNGGKVLLENAGFDLIGTTVSMSGMYQPKGYRSAFFDYHLKASDFDIQRAYKEVELFREMVTMAKDAYGIVSLDYKLEGKLDDNMLPVLPSLKGSGVLSLADIKFKGFKLLGAIAEKTDAKSLENGTLADVHIHSSIADNVLTIERTKMKMAGFRPRFEGQVSLDGDLNIGFRLGLPPLGVIGIPMKITGTADDFNIKLGKYKASEVLGREVDEDDDEEEDTSDISSVNDSLSSPVLNEVLIIN